ncbi:MAG: hypothetical protein ABSF83_07240 [Nitrososphaerales archaeon]
MAAQHTPDAREDVYFVLTSFAHVVIAVLFGVLLNPTQFPALLVVSFALSSKAFALFVGENQRFFTRMRWAALPTAALALAILVFLPPVDAVLGVVVMLLYLNYPRLLRARERSPLDVLFHGLRYALLFWLGYGGAVEGASLTGATVVFLFGITGELLVGLRNPGVWRTTASRLGTASTVRIVNVLTFSLIVLASLLFSEEVDFPVVLGSLAVPIPLLIGVVLAVFIMRPVSLGRSTHAPLSVRRREVVAIAIVALLLVSIPLVTRVDDERPLPQPGYTITLGMQALVAGARPYDVQWIVFNYQSPREFYYVLLYTNGTLELAREANGTRMPHLYQAQTGLSPFEWHRYQITVDGGLATISVDGKSYISAPIADPGGDVIVSDSIPHASLWLVWVTELQVSGAPAG